MDRELGAVPEWGTVTRKERKRRPAPAPKRMLQGLGTKIGFFGAMLFIAVALVVPMASDAARRRVRLYRVRHRFRETVCAVESSDVAMESVSRLVTRFGGGHQHRDTVSVVLYKPRIGYRYSVDGRPYQSFEVSPTLEASPDKASAAAVLSRYRIGQTYPCWYDPVAPETAFLQRE